MPSSARGAAAALLALTLLLAACSGGDGDRQAAPTTIPPTTTTPPTTEGGSGTAPTFGPAASSAQFRRARVRLMRVAELQQPVAMAARPGDQAVYVAEQTGAVQAAATPWTTDSR